MKEDKRIVWLIRLLLILLVFLCCYIFLKLKPIWIVIVDIIAMISLPVIISAFITYLIHPLIQKLQEHDVPRWLAVMLIFILFFGGFGIMLFNGLPRLFIQLHELANEAPSMFRTYESLGMKLMNEMYSLPEIFHDRIEATIKEIENFVDMILAKAIELVKGIIQSFFIFLIIPFLVFYFLKDIDAIKTAVWYFMPKKWRKHGQALAREIDRSLGQYIRGQFLVILILCVLSATVFWMLGLPYPILLGTIVGITEIIPYFGPIIGAVPALFVAMTISPKMVLWVMGAIVLLQLIEGSVLSPLIVGKSLNIHPIIIILVLLAGGEIAGIIGMLFAVPIFAILRVGISYVHGQFVKD